MMSKILALSNKKRALLCFLAFITLVSATIIDKEIPGTIITVAGSTNAADKTHKKGGFSGDGGPATKALLNENGGVAVDDSGNIYIADSQNSRIRKVYKNTGIIITIAGTGVAGYLGDSDLATKAQLAYPVCVRVDSLYNIYFSDAGNSTVRRITKGIIYTIAGYGNPGFSGDGGPATVSSLNYPVGICLDKYLNLYIADAGNNTIRKITQSTGVITSVAGNRKPGYSGNGGPAIAAELKNPSGVAVDSKGNVYIADFENNEVRVVDTKGIIKRFAGGTHRDSNFNGFNGRADTTHIADPTGIAIDAEDNVYIAEVGNALIRKVSSKTKWITLVAGSGDDGFGGDGGNPINAKLSYPFDIAIDRQHNIYIADIGNNRVRKIVSRNNK